MMHGQQNVKFQYMFLRKTLDPVGQHVKPNATPHLQLQHYPSLLLKSLKTESKAKVIFRPVLPDVRATIAYCCLKLPILRPLELMTQ
jgi:hypothetical protein